MPTIRLHVESVFRRHAIHSQGTVRTVLKRQPVLQRGHWLEMGMENAFKAIAVPFLAQLEIDVVREGIPVRAHLDFTMAG